MRLTLLGLVLTFLFACGDDSASGFLWANGTGHDCNPNTAAVSLPVAQVESLSPIPPIDQAHGDALWAAIALHVPGGWGGVYRQGALLVLMFVDTTQIAVSLDSLAVYGPFAGLRLPPTTDSLLLLRVRWNWIQLWRWYGYVEERLNVRGETASDIQETNNRLEFYGENAAARAAILNQLADLRVPCWLAAVGIMPAVQLADLRSPSRSPPFAGGAARTRRAVTAKWTNRSWWNTDILIAKR